MERISLFLVEQICLFPNREREREREFCQLLSNLDQIGFNLIDSLKIEEKILTGQYGRKKNSVSSMENLY